MPGGLSSKAMQAINWGVMAVSFTLLAATAVFGREVLDTFCRNMQYDGTTKDAVSEESFAAWEMVMWGGLGAGIAPACVAAVLLFFSLGCAKGQFGASMALSCILTSGLVAMSFGVTMQAHFRGLFAGLLTGIIMMAVILASGRGKLTGGSVMLQIGVAFLLFGGMSTALGGFAISRIEPCNTHRGCFPAAVADADADAGAGADAGADAGAGADAPAADAGADADADAQVNPFSTSCDWSCCDVQSTSTTCAEYASTSADACGACQPCLIDSSISTKLWACTGTGIALLVIGLVLVITRFAVPVP